MVKCGGGGGGPAAVAQACQIMLGETEERLI